MKRRQRSFYPQLRPVKLVLRTETEFDEVNEPKNLFRFLPVAITVFDSQAGRRSVLNKTLYASLASKVNTLAKNALKLVTFDYLSPQPKTTDGVLKDTKIIIKKRCIFFFKNGYFVVNARKRKNTSPSNQKSYLFFPEPSIHN